MISRRIQQRVRQFVTWIMRPLARLGITPNTLTLIGLLLSGVTAAVIAQGNLLVGGLLVLFAGIFDMFDGALARARNAASVFGAFFDSTLDRYSESIILFGLLCYTLRTPQMQDRLWPFPSEQSWMIVLIFIAVVGSLMVSYAKARAEGLGLECRTGLLARPERVVILAVGLLTGTTIWALTLLAVLSHVTTVERIIHVWRAATQSAHSAKQFAATTSAQGSDGSGSDRHAQIDADKQRDSSASSVPTGLPPLTGSVHHD